MGCGTVSQIQTLTPEQTAEMAMVDLAHMLLVETNEPINFHELMNRIGTIKNYSQEQIEQMFVQIYTEVNLDGRFVNIGSSTWGLKKWYPVEQYDDVTQPATKGKRKVVLDDDFEDLDAFDLEDDYVDEFEEEVFDEEELDEVVPDFDEEEIEDEEAFIEEDEVEIDLEGEEESLEELAEEEDVEDEEM